MIKISRKLRDKVDGKEWKSGCTTAEGPILKGLRELNVSVHLKKDLGMLSEIYRNQERVGRNQERISANQDWLKGILRFEALDLQKVELDFQRILV